MLSPNTQKIQPKNSICCIIPMLWPSICIVKQKILNAVFEYNFKKMIDRPLHHGFCICVPERFNGFVLYGRICNGCDISKCKYYFVF